MKMGVDDVRVEPRHKTPESPGQRDTQAALDQAVAQDLDAHSGGLELVGARSARGTRHNDGVPAVAHTASEVDQVSLRPADGQRVDDQENSHRPPSPHAARDSHTYAA